MSADCGPQQRVIIMTLEPLLNASPAIQFHVLTVAPAALIGGVMLLGRKGTPAHRLAGRVWIGLMVLAALSSFFIHTIRIWGPFSPIHVLSVVTLIAALEIIRSARQRNFLRHQRVVKSLYFGGIGIAGAFTFMPGRIMHEVVFGAGSSGNAAAVTSSAAMQVAGAAPVWVWPLLAGLIVLGISRMRDREMPVWRLMLLPALLLGSMLITVLSGSLSVSRLAAMAVGLALGMAAGWMSLRGLEVERLEGNRVLVRGERISLIAIVAIFVSRFANGALTGIAPHLLDSPGVAELFVAVPVMCAGVMAARALTQAGFKPLRTTPSRLMLEAES
jgi:uncharacterized membrane protein